MSAWIPLTEDDGAEVWVNMDRAEVMRRVIIFGNDRTEIHFLNDDGRLIVREPPAVIRERLNKESNE